MSDPTVPASSSTSTGASRVERGLATPGRRHFIVGGTAMLAALGLSPHAEASARHGIPAGCRDPAPPTRACSAGRATPGAAWTR